jgi:hypothetical protein
VSRVCDVSVEALKVSRRRKSVSTPLLRRKPQPHSLTASSHIYTSNNIYRFNSSLFFPPLYRQTHKHFVCVLCCVCVCGSLRSCGPRVLGCMPRTKVAFPLGLSLNLRLRVRLGPSLWCRVCCNTGLIFITRIAYAYKSRVKMRILRAQYSANA